MLVKIHRSYRDIVAVCDENLIGKRLEDSERQLDLTGDFFKGDVKDEGEVRSIMQDFQAEDACFNIVGDNSCRIALDLDLIDEKGIVKVQGIPVALVLM